MKKYRCISYLSSSLKKYSLIIHSTDIGSSQATGHRNKLTTGGVAPSDIVNRSNYKATGIDASGSLT